MAIYGPVAFALSTVVRAIALAVLASDFTGRDFQSLDAADDIFKSPVLIAATVIGFSGVIALGYWFVKGAWTRCGWACWAGSWDGSGSRWARRWSWASGPC